MKKRNVAGTEAISATQPPVAVGVRAFLDTRKRQRTLMLACTAGIVGGQRRGWNKRSLLSVSRHAVSWLYEVG